MIAAIFRRWWFLLTDGMWHGECAITIRDDQGRITVIGSVRHVELGVYAGYRIFWERKQPQRTGDRT